MIGSRILRITQKNSDYHTPSTPWAFPMGCIKKVAISPSSTLRRFVTAKDDNEQKQLVWGVLTDAQGVMHVTLRDFRPHVGQLIAIGLADTAQRLAQDYVDAYARGLNRYIRGLQHITLASHAD